MNEKMANQCIIISNLFKIFATHNHISHVNPVNFKDLFNPREPFGKTSFSTPHSLASFSYIFFILFEKLLDGMKIYVRKCNFTWNWINLSMLIHLSFYHWGDLYIPKLPILLLLLPHSHVCVYSRYLCLC